MTPDKQKFVDTLRGVDENLASMIEGELENSSLPIVKMRLRAAMVCATVSVDDVAALRDELHEIVTIIANDGLPEPRDADVAVDAILCVVRPGMVQ
jgi:hypothetical protein